MNPTLLSLIGPNASGCSPELYAFGESLGAFLCGRGYGLVCGGMGGFMEAVCKGVRESAHYQWGMTIGILPGEDPRAANPWCDIIIPSGFGIARNKLVVASGQAVIAAGGGAGTLSEIALAWQLDKPILCISTFGGWSEKLAGLDLDDRRTGLISEAGTLEQVGEWLKKMMEPTA